MFQVKDEHVGLVMEALSHRRAEVLDMGPVAGSVGRTRISMTCPSRLALSFSSVFNLIAWDTIFVKSMAFIYIIAHFTAALVILIFHCCYWFVLLHASICKTLIKIDRIGNLDQVGIQKKPIQIGLSWTDSYCKMDGLIKACKDPLTHLNN